MSDMRRILELAGIKSMINESHFDSQTDAEILSKISDFSPENTNKTFDALDILKGAGFDGLKGNEWMAALSKLYPTDDHNKAFLVDLAKRLLNVRVKKIETGGFRWITEGTHDIEPMTRDAMIQQMHIAGDIMKYAKELTDERGGFTSPSLARTVSSRLGISPDMAMQAVMYVMHNPQNSNTFIRQSDGTYVFNDPKEKSPHYMDTFKSFLNPKNEDQ